MYTTPRSSSGDAASGCASILGLLFFILLGFRGCMVDGKAPVEAVCKTHGFTDCSTQDFAFFMIGFRGCQIDEAARFKVTAVNPKGERVNFLVCTGWPFKGATIRTDW